MKLIRKSAIGFLGISLLVGGSFSAQAGTGYDDFYEVVGKFNGSSYTDSQKKAQSGATGDASIYNVGGDRAINVRMVSNRGNGDWSRNLGDNSGAYLYNDIPIYADTELQVNNKITTPVDVAVRGTWSSN